MPAATTRDRLSWRASRVAADLAERRARGGSATTWSAADGCTRIASAVRGNCGPATRSRISSICWRRSASARRGSRGRSRRNGGRRTKRAGACSNGSRAAGVPADARLIVIHVSSSSPFRRWPADSFAEAIADLAGSAAGPPDRGHRRTVRSRRGRTDRRRRARPPDGRGSRAMLRCGEFSLAELRALVDAAALYIGGDSGPLHIAAASQRADRRAVRPDAAGPIAPVAKRLDSRARPWMPASCRAGRATSACARPAISAA